MTNVSVVSDDEAREIGATLNTDRRQMSAEQRREVVGALRKQEHSTTAIAGALGVSDETVRRDISASTHVEPERVTGLDGKRYPSKRPNIVASKTPREGQARKDIAAEELRTGTQFAPDRTTGLDG